MRAGPGPQEVEPAAFRQRTHPPVLSVCIAVSVALHAGVLLAFPGLSPVQFAKEASVLTAAFVPKVVSPVGRVTSAPLPGGQRETGPEPAALFSEPEPLVPEQPQPNDPSLSPPVAGVASAAPDAMVPAPAGEKSSDGGGDAGFLEKYRLTLIDAVKRYGRYPPQAMERGWQGRVEVRLVVASDGAIRGTLVRKSSTYRILDDQALDMVKRGLGREPVPPALWGREFTLDIPVIFELRSG